MTPTKYTFKSWEQIINTLAKNIKANQKLLKRLKSRKILK